MPKPMTREEEAAQTLDDLLVLFQLYKEDYHIVKAA
jgi:hypothetical protein